MYKKTTADIGLSLIRAKIKTSHKNNIIYFKKLHLAQKLRLNTENFNILQVLSWCETNIVTHLMVNDDVWITTNWAGVSTYLVTSLETEVPWLF